MEAHDTKNMIQRISASKFTTRLILLVAMLLAISFTASVLLAEEPELYATIEACQKESQIILLEDIIFCGEEEKACLKFGPWLPWHLFPKLKRGCEDQFTTCNQLAEDAHEERLANCSGKLRQEESFERFGVVPY